MFLCIGSGGDTLVYRVYCKNSRIVLVALPYVSPHFITLHSKAAKHRKLKKFQALVIDCC